MWPSARHLAYNFSFISIVLLFRCGESESSHLSSDTSYSDYYHGNATMKQLRFRDFEPRQQSTRLHRPKPLEDGREARGFHFHPSGDDVSVEMEFIVPFCKIPVVRSMSVARSALRSLLNLRTGALLNTAVVVAAGAIIAAVVRLLLAPLVVNSFGYAKSDGHTTTRGMRSLTDVVESQLDEHNIDMSACAQRYICRYLQHNAASSHAKLIDSLAHWNLFDAHLNGTAVFKAIGAAREGGNCTQIYRSCRWPQLQMSWLQAWPRFMQYFNG